MIAVVCILALVAIVSATAFVLFMFDKHCAGERLRRVPESTLLLVAWVGVSAGGGESLVNNTGDIRPRKSRFEVLPFSIAGIQVAIVGWLMVL
jgi:uncharacterized membrane protein YsdA (DUF1294 family)